MTGGQLFVLVLLLAAFGAGWYAGAAGRREDGGAARESDVDEAARAADEALERALGSYRVLRVLTEAGARSAATVAFDDALAEARTAMNRLADVVGGEHPLVDDVDQATSALELLRSDADAPRELQAALERAARECQLRLRRTAAAIRALPRPGAASDAAVSGSARVRRGRMN